MKRIALLLPLVLGFAAGYGAAQEVTYNFDRDSDFSKFRSYRWVDIKSVRLLRLPQFYHLKGGETLLSVDLFLSVHGLTGEAKKFVTWPKEWGPNTLALKSRDGGSYVR